MADGQPGRQPELVQRAVVAGSIGNLVEWYDFALFGAFATTIAATFFPGDDEGQALLTVFGIFGLAFIVRPFGALLFGHLGDRLGRRRVLATTLLMMAVATAGIGLLPSRETLGWGAPVLLILLRTLQGVAIGGEFGGSAALVIEGVPRQRRGWYGGWHWATTGAGLAIGIGAAALVGAVPSTWAVQAWAWRLPFLLALPLGFVGLVVRRSVEESPAFSALRRGGAIARRPVRDALRHARPELAVGFSVVAAAAVAFNVFYIFLPNHLVLEGRIDLPTALGAAFLGPLVASITAPAFGGWSDHVGRKPVVVGGLVGLLVAIAVATRLVASGSPAGLLAGFAILGIPLGALSLTAFLAELFPAAMRHSGISLTYGLASALLGGTAPAVATILSRPDGGLVAPGGYAMAFVAGALLVLLVAPYASTGNRARDEATTAPRRAERGEVGQIR